MTPSAPSGSVSSSPSVVVCGAGASGLIALQRLVVVPGITVSAFDMDSERMELAPEGVHRLRSFDPVTVRADLVVLATPVGEQQCLAKQLLQRGIPVVATSDGPEEIVDLLALDAVARRHETSLVVGVGMAPGVTCLLSRHAGACFDSVDEIAIAKTGTGGPACARQHHRALKRAAWDYVGGTWVMRRGSSGRDLVWFPDPIGARDCYRADLASPLLLQRVYPGASRISARMSATRRDRATFRLPMLRPPHPDGGPGAVRVEVRGLREGHYETVVYGVMDHPSRTTGELAALVAERWLAGGMPPGAYGLAELDDPVELLSRLGERGFKIVTI